MKVDKCEKCGKETRVIVYHDKKKLCYECWGEENWEESSYDLGFKSGFLKGVGVFRDALTELIEKCREKTATEILTIIKKTIEEI